MKCYAQGIQKEISSLDVPKIGRGQVSGCSNNGSHYIVKSATIMDMPAFLLSFQMTCHPLYTDLSLKGSFKTAERIQWTMYVGKKQNNCPFGPCLSNEEFASRFSYLELQFVVFNPYIDFNNIDDPLLIGVDEKDRAMFSPDFITEYRLFIKENTYNIDNSFFYPNMLTGSFFLVKNTVLNIYPSVNEKAFGVITFW